MAENEQQATAPGPEVDEHELMSPRRILVATGLFIIALVAIAAALGAFFRDPLQQLSSAFVELLGGPGIAVGYLIPDAFTVPVPNDAFGWFGLEGGVPFWEVVAWGTAGSVTGGCVGYLIGQRLRTT